MKQLKEASNADRLFLYGYFKQSTIGDVNIRTFGVLFGCPAALLGFFFFLVLARGMAVSVWSGSRRSVVTVVARNACLVVRL